MGWGLFRKQPRRSKDAQSALDRSMEELQDVTRAMQLRTLELYATQQRVECAGESSDGEKPHDNTT